MTIGEHPGTELLLARIAATCCQPPGDSADSLPIGPWRLPAAGSCVAEEAPDADDAEEDSDSESTDKEDDEDELDDGGSIEEIPVVEDFDENDFDDDFDDDFEEDFEEEIEEELNEEVGERDDAGEEDDIE